MWLNKVTYWLKVTYSNTWFTKIYFRDKLHDGRGDYQALDHMHKRTKLSYVCARAKSLEHSLPLKLICYGKEGSERIESWHLAGSNLFLSFWEIFFLFTFSKYDRPLNESTTCRGNFWKRPKNNSQICNFQPKKKNDAKLQLDKYLVIRTFNL